MRITQKQAGSAILAIQVVANLIALGWGFINQESDPANYLPRIVATLILGVLLWAYWRGWEAAAYINLVITSIMVAFVINDPINDPYFSATLFLPPAIALVYAGPLWIAGVSIFNILALLVQGNFTGPYAAPIPLFSYILSTASMVIGRLILDHSRRMAEANAEQARLAQAEAHRHAQEVARQAEDLAKQNAEQGRLLDLVSTLETPVVTLAEGVLLAPMVGHLDERRIEAATERLLEVVYGQRTRLVILDIAGVVEIDSAVAQGLSAMAQALRLLGCKVAISGIAANVAATLSQQDIDLGVTQTVRSPQEALANYLLPQPTAAESRR